MKTFAAIALLAAVATAQFDNIPQCALNCFITPLTTDGCSSLTDFACHCKKSDSLLSSVTPCVQKGCTADEQAKVISAVEETCASAGVTINVPGPSSAAPASSAPAASTSQAAASSGYPASSATPTPTPVSSAVYSASTPAGTGSPVTPSGNGTVPTSPTPSQFSGNNAAATQAPIFLGAAALAMLAL